MPSLVTELQHDALNSTVPVGNLLRKALVVARKLTLKGVEEWIPLELNGYHGQDVEKLPSYRKVRGQVMAFNPYNGWVSTMFATSKEADVYSIGKLTQPVAELEEMLRSTDKDPLVMSYSHTT